MRKNKVSIAIIVSQYWKEITGKLLSSCLKELKKEGLSQKQIDVFEVPGALEIPLLAKKLAKKKKYSGLIALGMVLKGKTLHFEQVSQECVRGCTRVSYNYEIPLAFEVICVYKKDDALKRAVPRGREAALTLLKTIKAIRDLNKL